MKKYLRNCFILLIPILLWNLGLARYLPQAYQPVLFWKDIPDWIGFGENALRIVIMIIPAIMILSIKTASQKLGLILYAVGTALYFFSWIALIVYPDSQWSQSLFGFTAPAYTPIVWLIGIGLIGSKSFFKMKNVTFIYISLSLLFAVFHVLHTFLVYQKL